jgi:DNA-binding MarR family transcriptional regulator
MWSSSLDHMDEDTADRDLGMAGWLAFQLYRVALGRGLAHRGFDDLRDSDGTLLRYLHHSGGATVTEVSRLFGVTKQAASQQLASFVDRGYGERTRLDTDARVRVVVLSQRGRAARRAVLDISDEVEAQLVARLGRDAMLEWRRVADALVDRYLDEAPEQVRVAAAMSSMRD